MMLSNETLSQILSQHIANLTHVIKPYMSVLPIIFGAAIAMIFFLDNQALNALASLAYLIGIYRSWKNPFTLLLGTIPLFFCLPPVPDKVALPEILLGLSLLLYTCFSYNDIRRSGNQYIIRYIVIITGFFIAVVTLSFFYASSVNVAALAWFRGIAPFTLIYLAVPISISLQNSFKKNFTLLLISCATLTLLLATYINYIYFIECLHKTYWLLAGSNTKIYDAATHIQRLPLLGPYRDRITMRIPLATSELLPVGLVLFTINSVFQNRSILKGISLLSAIIILFSILETYTRSMLLSGMTSLGFTSILIYRYKPRLRRTIMTHLFIIVMAGVAFTNIVNINTILLGRLNLLTDSLVSLSQNYLYSSLPNFHRENKGNTIQHTESKSTNDENVNVRVREYQIAYELFLKHPIFGAGIGVKHNIDFKTSTGISSPTSVGYIHNWILYWLMCGGLIGLVGYTSILLYPIYFIQRLGSAYSQEKFIISSAVLTITTYSCFFAVFRLLTFNLILAISWGAMLALWYSNFFNSEHRLGALSCAE